MEKLYKKYKYIVAWGKKMGSYKPYIERQLEQAEKDKAPENAVYRKDDGSWATTSGWTEHSLKEMEDYINGIKGGILL